MSTPMKWLTNTRDWLDGHGKAAWIATMVLGFIFFWPVGLVILFYMIGTNRMGNCKKSRRAGRINIRFGGTGNEAFDSYRDETLKRLEDEQTEFQNFMAKLRAAKDQAEFDQFMDNRAKQNFDAAEEQSVPNQQKQGSSGDYSSAPGFA